MSLAAKQQSLIDDLNLIGDVHERLAALSSFAAAVALPAALKTDDLLVPGCLSRVWLHGDVREGRTSFRCDADSPLVKSLVALLCHLYSGATPAEAAAVEPLVWQACGFTKVLSPTRLNGLAHVRARIRALAIEAAQQPAGN